MSIASIKLIRDYITDTATMGRMLMEGEFVGYTLERPWKNNERVVSCIPDGSYQGAVQYSPHFKRNLPELLDVPGRDQILIHAGNHVTDSQGCILLGGDRDVDGEMILHSRAAVNDLLDRLAAFESFHLEVQEGA